MKIKFLIAICISFAFFGCKKEVKTTYTFDDTSDKAYLKVIHVVSNALVTPTSAAIAPVNVYLDGEKINGTPVTAGSGVYPGLEFAAVKSGAAVSMNVKMFTGATTPEVDILTKSISLEKGGLYSAFLTDTIPTADVLLVKEDLSAVADSGKYFIRFVNLTPLSAGYDLYATTDLAMAFTNVPYKTASPFIQLPVGSGARSFGIRRTGVATNLATASVTPVAGRMYTIISYGIDGGTGVRVVKPAFYTTRFQTPL
ncbi:MAG: DUF4397 domain-containing protein [Rhizobacter sp.]|nr:DUF4397 domain-containing protein [Ferruginibacter sp.]